jgi:putative transposase
LLSNP